MNTTQHHNGRNGVADAPHISEPAAPRARKTPRWQHDALTMMAHELRTPLNALLGFAQMLLNAQQNPNLTADQQRQLELIARSGHHMAEIIDAMLELSLAHAGVVTLHPQSVLPAEMIDNLLAELASLALAKQQTLVRQAAPNLPPIQADRVLLRQILTNLIGNAIKFAPDASAIIVGAQPGPEETLEFFVRDAGPGILKKHQRAIFKPFAQIAPDAPRKQGAGLGLALTRQLVLAMGGTIGVQSAKRQGSTFWVRLPIVSQS